MSPFSGYAGPLEIAGLHTPASLGGIATVGVERRNRLSNNLDGLAAVAPPFPLAQTV